MRQMRITQVYGNSPNLRIRINGDPIIDTDTVEFHFETTGMMPEEIFKDSILEQNDPFTKAAVESFMENMTDAAILQILKSSQKKSI
jgi:hypothetical protein